MRSPFSLFALILLAIFVGEAAVMSLFELAFELPLFWEVVLDSLLLTVVIFPVLYYLHHIPLSESLEERRQARNEAVENAATLRSFLDNLPAAVFMKDLEGRYVLTNAMHSRILGKPNEEIEGKKDYDIYPEHTAKSFRSNDLITLETGEQMAFEDSIEVDGETRYFYTIKFPMKDTSGTTLALAGVALEITERIEAERETLQAKEKAEEATRLKDKFVSIVAHDLRSPFSSMRGLLELIHEDETHPPHHNHKKMLGAILVNCERMMVMIDELLQLSRLQSGKIATKRKFIDAYNVANLTEMDFTHLAKEKGVELRNEVAKGTRIYADPELFARVIENLISNAIKFSANGDTVTVVSMPDDPGGIAVRDTGAGIPDNILPNLFRHDIKTSLPGTNGENGTGLGLPMSFEIMEAHGGSLTVESAPGEGSVFFMKFPYVKPRALVACAESSVRDRIVESLRLLDADMFEADSDEAAELAIENNPPTLIIINARQGGKCGLGFLETVKRSPFSKWIPVIVIVPELPPEYAGKARELGADIVIESPFEEEELVELARRKLT